MSRRHSAGPSSSHSFNVFFEGWLARQQAFLHRLLIISSHHKNPYNKNNNYDLPQPPQLHNRDQLIEEVLAHYGEYYEEKKKLMREDILIVFSPPWLTSLEKSFLWVTGFKPSMAFHLVRVSVSNMVSEQVSAVECLKAATTREEREMTDAFASVQESVGSPPFMDLARQVGRLVDGEVSDFNNAMDELQSAMLKAVEKADYLRRTTVMKVVDILNPDQTVEFLIAVAKYHLGLRAWGTQNDLRRE